MADDDELRVLVFLDDLLGLAGVEDDLPDARSGAGGEALGEDLGLLLGGDVEDGEEQLVEVVAGDGAEGFLAYLNADSLKVATAYVEPLLGEARPGEAFQFERTGYFCADAVDSAPGRPVFNRTVTLKDGYKPS